MTTACDTRPVEPVTHPDDQLTVSEVASILHRTTDHVRTLVHSGRLPAELDPADRNYRIRRADLDEYRQGRAAPPSPMFEELGRFADDIAALQSQIDTLTRERNRAMLRWRDEHGASVTAIASAARVGRQHATDVLRVARAEARAEATWRATE